MAVEGIVDIFLLLESVGSFEQYSPCCELLIIGLRGATWLVQRQKGSAIGTVA